MCEPKGSSLELGALVGMGVDAATSKVGRKVMTGVAYVLFAAVIVYTLGWWLLPITLGLVTLAAAVLAGLRRVLRFAARGTITASPEIRHRLAARGVPALAHGQPVARPALPRAIVRSLTRERRPALPAPARVVEPTRVLAALPGAVNRTRAPRVR